jgi:hypothetical protein
MNILYLLEYEHAVEDVSLIESPLQQRLAMTVEVLLHLLIHHRVGNHLAGVLPVEGSVMWPRQHPQIGECHQKPLALPSCAVCVRPLGVALLDVAALQQPLDTTAHGAHRGVETLGNPRVLHLGEHHVAVVEPLTDESDLSEPPVRQCPETPPHLY